jgi:cell division protein FtsL
MLREEANQLDVEWGQLLLEQSTFGLDGRIEQKAVEQLRMQVPEIDHIVMVGRDARKP